jgi:hypothetical protein
VEKSLLDYFETKPVFFGTYEHIQFSVCLFVCLYVRFVGGLILLSESHTRFIKTFYRTPLSLLKRLRTVPSDNTRRRDSVVGIATGYGLDDQGVGSSSLGRVKNFLFSTARPAMGFTQPLIQWVPEDLSPGVKRPGCEADLSPPASAEVKKIWICTSTPLYAFMT